MRDGWVELGFLIEIVILRKIKLENWGKWYVFSAIFVGSSSFIQVLKDFLSSSRNRKPDSSWFRVLFFVYLVFLEVQYACQSTSINVNN
jgi:hypothetical protein